MKIQNSGWNVKKTLLSEQVVVENMPNLKITNRIMSSTSSDGEIVLKVFKMCITELFIFSSSS
jgi:hypothetical protein